MRDARQQKLARILVEYSTRVDRGDVVMISFSDGTPLEFVRDLQTICLKRKAHYVRLNFISSDLTLNFLRHAGPTALSYFPQHELEFMKTADVFIGIGAPLNSRVFSGISGKVISSRQSLLRPIQDERVNRTRWVITRYPTQSQAQEAGMSFEELEEFYFRACNIDWSRVAQRQRVLARRLSLAKKVRIVGPDTDLRFSLEGMRAVSSHGERNMPDGEVFTAPVLGSVEGRIRFNTVCECLGKQVVNPWFKFQAGRVIQSGADRGGDDLEVILNSDPGARIPGEFAFGLNRRIRTPMGNTLFDEKIAGSIHIALGSAYEDCDNGNRSAIHWDMVRLMSDGEVFFDGKLIQRYGRFIPKSLCPLNRL